MSVAIVWVALDPNAFYFVESYVSKVLEVPRGGVRFGAFGQDEIFHNGEHSGRFIHPAIFNNVWRANFPLLLGALLGLIKSVSRRPYWLVVGMAWLVSFAVAHATSNPQWRLWTAMLFDIFVMLSVVAQLRAAKAFKPFCLGYAGALLALILVEEQFGRALLRVVYQAQHAVMPGLSEEGIAATARQNLQLVQVVMAIFVGLFVHWKFRTGARQRRNKQQVEEAEGGADLLNVPSSPS